MLEIRDLSVSYGPIRALKNVSLEVNPHEITAIIGANGAGKSTLLNTISGLVKPEKGEIVYDQISLNPYSIEKRVKMGIAHVLEGRHLFKDQTVHDNLLIALYFRQPDKKKRKNMNKIKEVYERFPILYEKREQFAGTLSGGQQQMLAIAMALLSEPKLLLLDEPSLGLAPVIVDEVYHLLQELNRQGMTILISEQIAALALRIAHRGYILENGKVIEKGDRDYLKSLLASNGLSVYLSTKKEKVEGA